jgi:hypothetical protein
MEAPTELYGERHNSIYVNCHRRLLGNDKCNLYFTTKLSGPRKNLIRRAITTIIFVLSNAKSVD